MNAFPKADYVLTARSRAVGACKYISVALGLSGNLSGSFTIARRPLVAFLLLQNATAI